jgi:hypothetical protein
MPVKPCDVINALRRADEDRVLAIRESRVYHSPHVPSATIRTAAVVEQQEQKERDARAPRWR